MELSLEPPRVPERPAQGHIRQPRDRAGRWWLSSVCPRGGILRVVDRARAPTRDPLVAVDDHLEDRRVRSVPAPAQRSPRLAGAHRRRARVHEGPLPRSSRRRTRRASSYSRSVAKTSRSSMVTSNHSPAALRPTARRPASCSALRLARCTSGAPVCVSPATFTRDRRTRRARLDAACARRRASPRQSAQQLPRRPGVPQRPTVGHRCGGSETGA